MIREGIIYEIRPQRRKESEIKCVDGSVGFVKFIR